MNPSFTNILYVPNQMDYYNGLYECQELSFQRIYGSGLLYLYIDVHTSRKGNILWALKYCLDLLYCLRTLFGP